jgi:anti-sigma regulatory factor (Ser/Thr protein kinase)
MRAWELFVDAVSETTATQARQFTDRVLQQAGLTHLLEDTRLIVSELVGNVFRYVGGPMWLDLELWEQTLRVVVVDAGYPFVLPQGEVDWEAVSGRGLLIIQALATLDLKVYVAGKALVASLHV